MLLISVMLGYNEVTREGEVEGGGLTVNMTYVYRMGQWRDIMIKKLVSFNVFIMVAKVVDGIR